MKRAAAIVVVLVGLCSALDAYVFLNDRWADGSIVMQLQLGSSGSLIDGRSSWNASAEDALAVWNTYLDRVKFRVVRDSNAPTGDNNGYNNVIFSSAIYTQSFGPSTLAVTTNWYRVSSGQRIEADVIFNTAFSWNSYAGTLRRAPSGGTLADLHRVALHEFGHVLGLNHPDQAGQSVGAIMNSSISNVDSLLSDDVSGAAVLYGGSGGSSGGGGGTSLTQPGAPTGLTTAASGTTVTLSWRAPSTGGSPSAYVIEAGSDAGLSNLANFSTGSRSTSFAAAGVGSGAYYFRVKARNAAGTSGASNESLLTIGGGICSAAPGAPSGFSASANGSTVTLRWNAASGNPATYVVEAGSAPGSSNFANSDLGSPAPSYVATGVGRGTYYVRMRGKNACGTGLASNEAVLVVQ
jgi:matrixin